MWKEFKEFAVKGNVIDLAVGVIIGTAFNKIVSSLVIDLIMPIFSLFIGKESFSDLAYKDIHYGSFIQSIVDFFIIGLSLFFIVKVFNKLENIREKHEETKEEEKEEVSKEEQLLTEIRDLLRKETSSSE
ncbi:large conductance mechanosensitive channel protein MscL [Bacillus andreraoultii]|uniref:large conductance mechanosensitive channel protein MscL n=1 Tax=Bacillus andreraoultii TaxID=1499685 RepID=UPI00053A057C|nr:large conductance mechanosensitive channel protein MscL [Bacillus andreraoultii]